MCHACALPPALDPLFPPPPNISRLGDVWDHWTWCNVRRGGRRKAETAKKACLILPLIPDTYVYGTSPSEGAYIHMCTAHRLQWSS